MFRNNLFFSLILFFCVAVGAAADVTPPQLESWTLSATSINVDESSATVTATYRLTDPSGVSSPSVTASHDSGQGTGFASTSRISGDEFDGTWQSVLTVDQGAAAGEWSVSLFPLRDTLGNSGSFGPSNQFNRVFTVGVVAPNTAPTIAIEGAATLTLNVGETWNDPGALAVDDEDGVVSVIVTNPVDSSTPGSYTVEYRVTDSGGLTSAVTRTVIVIQPLSRGALRFAAGQVIELPVIGTALAAPNGDALVVPTTATAASINVTAVTPGGSGFITVWPCGVERPLASNLNYVAGDVVPNGVLAPIGSNGKVCIYSLVDTDLVVDVAGWFEGDAFVGATPLRLRDTRETSRVTSAQELVLQVADIDASTADGSATRVPADVGAVALNVTVVSPDSAGFVTVYPCGTRPLASNVNYTAGQIVPNGVIAPVSANGEVCIFSLAPTDIIVDLAGWFPGDAFTATTPQRLVDTRDGTGGQQGKLTPTGQLNVPVHGETLSVSGNSAQVPLSATAAALNVTIVNPERAGFATVWPCSAERPLASNLNFVSGQVVANNVIAPIGDQGSVCFYTNVPSDIIVDIAGYFSGEDGNQFVGSTPKRYIDTRSNLGPAPISLDPIGAIDTDGDGIDNNSDPDDDGDGVEDTRDPAPLDDSLTPPTAVLTLDVNEGVSPLRVLVKASSSIAGFGDDTIKSYTWNFGDGDSSTEEVTSHIYTQEGSFEIALTVTNSDDLAHTTTQIVNTTLPTDPLVIGGTISVSSSVAVDSDVNDSGSTPVSNNTRATAQFVTNPVTIGGFANEAGTGPNFDGLSNLTESGDDFDGYRINALGGEIINLRIATRGQGDLDLFLYDNNDELIDFSVSATDNESIVIPAGVATYDIVVESFSGFSNYVLSVGQDPAIASHSNASASTEVFIGDVVVQPQNDYQTPRMLAQPNRVIGAHVSARASPRLYQFGDKITELLAPGIRARMLPGIAMLGPSKAELKLATMLAAKQLNRQGDVEYAEPNYRVTPKIEPNDIFYGRQWHYPKVNLPAAWDKTTGSANVKIAVLDTGVVANHPDLQARLSADSYDFISSISNGGDGDGVDSDGSDPGDGQDNTACSTSSFRSSSFHGTHVAGTIGASTNNNIGTAGIMWSGEIMNLRVLGCEGGSTFDIAQALLYAAGIENAFGLSPTKKADVANLSLGGGSPSNVMTNAVQDARAAGLIIIAAAGNDGDSTLSYPASYDGVISVAATDLGDQRAFYSQFNARVDIAAPGGDTSTDQDADGFPDGVLSTLASLESGTRIDFEYEFYQGTSMATPHVAGIVALMKSVNPSLTPALLDQLLSSGTMTVDLGASGRDDDFGHGRIDALLAVEAAQQLADGTIPITDTPVLGVSPRRVSFGATLTERNITLFNAGTGALAISAFTPSSSRITVTPPTNTDGVGAYTLTLNRDGATAGQYMESVSIASNGGSAIVNVQYEIPGANQQVSGSVGELYVFLIDFYSGESTVQQYQSSAGQYEYRFTDVEPGVYYIIAGSDPDNDGFVGGSGEALGTYPTEDDRVLIIANRDFENLDFNVTYEIPLEAGVNTQREPVKKGTQVACQPLSQARKSLPCILLIGR